MIGELLRNAQPMPQPRMPVLDSPGREIAIVPFYYGRGFVGARSGRAPPGVRGKLRAVPVLQSGPSAVQAKPVEFTVR